MKNFFTSFFATLTGLLVFFFGGAMICFLLFAAIAASSGGEKPVQVTKGSYLVLDLSANIQDTPDQMEGFEQFMDAFGGDGAKLLQLRSATRALQAAASDPDIAGVFIRGQLMSNGYGSGFAALRELREAVETFKASGKPVKAYMTFGTTRDYYVMSAASEMVLDPYGAIFMPGLASQPMFFAGAFEKFGIGVQVTRVGKYKSAVEPFTRKEMSPENRAQTQKLLDDLWAEIVTGIEQARNLAPGSLQQAVDAAGILQPEPAKKLKLVDRVAYYDVVIDELKAATGRTGPKSAFKQIGLKDYAKLVSGDGLVAKRRDAGKVELSSGGKGKVAILYAEGEIVDGNGNDREYIWGQKVARQIRELRQDPNVKALVLRVNSPGGSATASEAIQRELRLMQKTKPVIVSMGTVAASGGYWISTYSDRIFAEPNTITGSIGVFGMFLNFQGLANDKLGLTFDTVKTGKFADVLTATRPKTPEELAVFQHLVDWIYDEFVGKVAESRKLDRAVVQEIAQGRVWSGTEAKKLGLVDEIGGLSAATKYAAEKAQLGDKFQVAEYPRKKQFAEALSEAFEGRHREYTSAGPIGVFVQQAMAQLSSIEHLNDPQGVYARLPFELGLK
ncbi:MAG TPA: signal peptide peptidase SppA [Candidatus Didemnitutus sp.]|nr:signal peptide peptidase SppA [Candidatus Didemnitutus sp.]